MDRCGRREEQSLAEALLPNNGAGMNQRAFPVGLQVCMHIHLYMYICIYIYINT